MAAVTAQTLDGTRTATTIKTELTERVGKLREQGVVAGLGTILVGDDPGSRWYVNGKHKDCAEVGIGSIRVELPATASQAEVAAEVDRLNEDPACTGYLVQLPLPAHLDEHAVLGRVDPDKDADGLHPTNLGWLVLGKPAPLPCTPAGIVELLRRHDVPVAGADVCVIGRGVTVGRPLGLLLTRRSENATVTQCHTGTRDLPAHVRGADVVVAAAGVTGIVSADMVKPGAAVLDVGVSRVDGKLAGDVAPGRVRRGRLGLAQPRRRRPDDAGDAAVEHRRRGRGILGAGLRMTPVAGRRRVPQTLGGAVYLLVLLVALVGLALAVAGPWRTGLRWLGSGLLLAALTRSVLSDRGAGMLRVRRRWSDIVWLVGCGVALLVLATVIPDQPG